MEIFLFALKTVDGFLGDENIFQERFNFLTNDIFISCFEVFIF